MWQDDIDRESETTHKKLMELLSRLRRRKDVVQDKNSIESTTDSDDRNQTHDKESLKKSDQPLESIKIKDDLKAKNENDPLSKEREERKRESLQFEFEINQLNEKNKAAIARVEKTANNIRKNQLDTDETIKNVEKQHVDIDVEIKNIGKQQQSAIILYSAVAGFDGDKGAIPANSDLSSSTKPQQSSFLLFLNPLSWF